MEKEKVVKDINITERELDKALEKGYADMMAGKTKPAKRVFADIRRDYAIKKRCI